MSDQLFRWVKANERLPKTGDISFARIDGHLLSLIQVSVNTGKIHFAGVLKPTEYPYSIIEWLEPYTPSPISGSLELNHAARDYAEKLLEGYDGEHGPYVFNSYAIQQAFLAGAAYVKGAEERLKGYNGSLLREYNKMLLSLLNNPTDEEIIGKLNELSPSVEKEIDEYEMIIASRPSLDIDKVVDELRAANPYHQYEDGISGVGHGTWEECCDKLKELLNTPSQSPQTPIDTEPEGIDGMGNDPL